jgi:predicted GIY-YIG superfamily endonuclease
MFGIYKITNNLNNKIYIGKSSMIEDRWKYHKTNYKNSSEWDKTLY